ncbi:hypothetical protein Lal_00046387 [Lupinus albus]|nr:hypothetical protein Lal_00046387 [Lupinus albus]
MSFSLERFSMIIRQKCPRKARKPKSDRDRNLVWLGQKYSCLGHRPKPTSVRPKPASVTTRTSLDHKPKPASVMPHIELELQETIASIKQGSLTVTNYFTELKIMWDEMDNFRLLPKCCCEIPYSCDALIKGKNHRTKDRVIRFLRGLNDAYASVSSQIMLIEPLPNMSRVFSLIVQQERQLSTETERKALATTTEW